MEAQSQIKRTLSQPQALARVRALQATVAPAHRTALADRVCVEFGFIDGRGRGQRAGCLKALRALEREGALTLPAPCTAPGPRQARRLEAPVAPPQAVPAKLAELVGLELVVVENAAQRALWNELMVREHPRGLGPLVGCQLRYLIGSAHGWLGAIGLGAAALQLAPRDHWIGWDGTQRGEQLHRIVGLTRFLLRPGVHCRYLASHVLGRLLRRLGGDFEARYGYRPWLVETFVETARHTGVSLRAANWQYIGDTAGRGRQDRAHAGAESAKAIYVYGLEADWRQRLGVGPAPSAGEAALAPGDGLDDAHWAEQEFGGAPLGDQRRSQRLVVSARLQSEQPMRGFTGVAEADWPAVKGYYRLIDQPADSEVTPDHILAPHRERTRQRMAAQTTVLCIADGTDVNFTTHAQTAGLGVIGRNQTGAQSRGLHLHSTLAVSGEGLPLGVLRARFEAPRPRDRQAAVAAEDKKSFRWIESLRDCAALAKTLPDTRVIHVADREADCYDLLAEQLRTPEVDLIVRAKSNRRLPDAQGRLFDGVRETKPRTTLAVEITRRSPRAKTSKRPACAGRTQRSATLTLRYRQVKLARHRHNNPHVPATLAVTIVHAVEDAPPPGEAPVEWFVLTTLAVDTPAQAEQVLHYYSLRWRIEDWHRVLKSGCRIDELGHHSTERLERAIAMRLVIAWRVMLMTLLGREVPDLPPELLFSDPELRVLGDVARSKGRRPPSKLGEAVIGTAILGGYLNRNHDPPPGHQLMWQGYTILAAMAKAYLLRDEFGQ
ncbi:IS4 family transposase [Salinisphaera sp. SWV1]|uniref:IS4 family transposase n=1 Tax=Salinisphaera sp. SWV1 TaxID=3454139 RepID=UPI003F841030